ncbi:glycosyltransferase family 4 protein [Roseomonas sp. E05]|uniref:glycosyltransferase family 4 protein n=1 Tax=Roseomonas sp. E05 TaxID=3046310 RepID=UPI0024B9C59E|nr:glycosyltransferase family 4 protein [Roseomonas sp. E05]MDJ0389981.1 glycosyltransferase family 4 protein [Roseomonas sp. E05]
MTADAVGGVWSYALDLARGLIGEGVEVVLAVLGPAPGARQRAEAAAIPGLRIVETGLALEWTAEDAAAVLEAGTRLAALARAEGVGLVHLNSPALAAGGAFTVPVVAACHSCVASWWEAVRGGPLPADLAWRSALVAEGYRAAGRLLAPSAAFAATTARLYGLAEPPRVVHNGRARPPAAQPPAALPERFVFAAGRLWDEGKNLGLLDGIAARLSLPVVTAGALAGPQGGAIALPNLRNLGSLDSGQMAACFRAASLFVSPARYEPFGLAVLEAAQAGCPLVLSDIGSFREIWGETAEYANPDDGSGFVAAIERLLGDPALLRRRGAAAAERAQRYTPAAMARATRDLYRAALSPQHCQEAHA